MVDVEPPSDLTRRTSWTEWTQRTLGGDAGAPNCRGRAARRVRDEHAVLLARERAEAERLRRNALGRARYRARREGGVTRTDRRRGMHAIAIVADPAAYQALKLEARHRSVPLPSLLGEVVIADLRSVPASPMTDAPRWRRTGEGRQANKHTRIERIEIDDEAWEELHADAPSARRLTPYGTTRDVPQRARGHRSGRIDGSYTRPPGAGDGMGNDAEWSDAVAPRGARATRRFSLASP